MPRTSLWYLTGILSIVFFQASFDEFKLFLVLILMPSDMQSNLHTHWEEIKESINSFFKVHFIQD